jgi:hypothetical protein
MPLTEQLGGRAQYAGNYIDRDFGLGDSWGAAPVAA